MPFLIFAVIVLSGLTAYTALWALSKLSFLLSYLSWSPEERARYAPRGLLYSLFCEP